MSHSHDADQTQPTSPPDLGPLSPEDAILKSRADKAHMVREAGEDPFSNVVGRYERIHDVVDRYASAHGTDGRYDAPSVVALASSHRVVGRLIAVRSFGKAAFLRLRDGSGELQLFCRKDVLADFGRLVFAGGAIDVADHVVAEGKAMVTKTGELSLELVSIGLLTKAQRPLPEKFHGLTDVELRYRQRYVDLVSNPEVADVFRGRAFIVRAVRKFLDDRQFLEVETPTISSIVGGATAKPFHTHHNALDMGLFLRIAPELFLKRCLVGGLDRVYEIGRCYRNEGISTRHNPEFTMLEFYEAYATYEHLMDTTESMLREVDQGLAKAMPGPYAIWKSTRPFDLDAPFARISMADATKNALRKTEIADLVAAADSGLSAIVELFSTDFASHIKGWAEASKRDIDWGNLRKGLAKCENVGEKLFALYEYFAEPYLTDDYRTAEGSHSVPVFVIDHPFEISPLARRKDSDPGLTDRFELFIDGRELANAFSELNDPDDQAARFAEQVAKKGRGADETMDYDEDYVRALQHGMPPAAGFGMGIDRLVMFLCHQPSIRDVILFPLLRPEVSRRLPAADRTVV